MNAVDAERLQRSIEETVGPHGPFCIELDRDADVTDLTRNITVRVSKGGDPRVRLFSLVTAAWVQELFASDCDMFCTGGPLIVVREINASVIVRAVRRYHEIAGESLAEGQT